MRNKFIRQSLYLIRIYIAQAYNTLCMLFAVLLKQGCNNRAKFYILFFNSLFKVTRFYMRLYRISKYMHALKILCASVYSCLK